MKYIFGNWKAHKNLRETQQWIDAFTSRDLNVFKDSVRVIVCPPFPFIEILAEAFSAYDHIHVGAQDVSMFGPGAYTGDVTAHTLAGLVDYAIIGHSEKRKYFNEANAHVEAKFQSARLEGIEPLVCVRGTEDALPDDVRFVAYEPVEAIGTGYNEPPESVLEMKNMLNLTRDHVYIYGGSVTADNVAEYLRNDEIDGVLPGGASLDVDAFYNLLTAAAHATE